MEKLESRLKSPKGSDKDSPLLFNIFMAGLAKDLANNESGLKLDNKKINSIFWADDIVLLAENQKEWEAFLTMVSDYCRNNKLTINCKKKTNA